MISWTLVLGFRIHQFRFEKRSLTTKINLPLFLQQSKIRAAFACPLFLQTHRACRMQSSEADGASQRGKRKGRNIPARAHYGRCSRFAFTAGGPLLQVNFAIESTPFALRTCTVSWLQGCSCFVQLHEDSGRGMQTCGLMGSSKWKRRSLA
jgi:hypothetical protein